jgi:hypothetical protein
LFSDNFRTFNCTCFTLNLERSKVQWTAFSRGVYPPRGGFQSNFERTICITIEGVGGCGIERIVNPDISSNRDSDLRNLEGTSKTVLIGKGGFIMRQ